MSNKQLIFANLLSGLLTLIAAIVLVGCTWTFIRGQMDANRAIVDAGKAVIAATTSNDSAQSLVDYSAAIAYLEAAQQAYSENSVIKVISLIYTLSSSIILGYGAKMLRLGASDKQELCEELLEKTQQQFNESSDQILRQQNDVYAAVTTCENVAHLSLLLLSYFDLTSTGRKSTPATEAVTDTTERLQIELTRSLSRFRDFLVNSKDNLGLIKLTQDQLAMLRHSWEQTQKSVNEYILPKKNGEKSCLESHFGEYDQIALEELVKEIKYYWKRHAQ